LLLIILGIYFLPTIVAGRHHNSGAIFVLNLLLGWTFVGWVIALVWAFTKPGDRNSNQSREPDYSVDDETLRRNITGR
jgi:hypothetical protein